jgi:DNA-binding beta-propeller fold protein YncE
MLAAILPNFLYVRLRIAVAAALLAATPLLAQPLVVRTLAGPTSGGGVADAFGISARFSVPQAISADAAGNFWVADTGNHVIRKVTRSGDVMTVAGEPGVAGFADGAGAAARFRFPAGIAVDPVSGDLWISDKDNHVIRRMTPGGAVTTIAGQPGVAGAFAYPRGIVVDNTGAAYVADTQNHAIRRITSDGAMTTFAGRVLAQGSADGTGDAARFRSPTDIAIDPTTGNFYVSDTGNDRIRRITPAAVVTTLATIESPWGLDVDGSGNVYVADHDNHRVRRVTPAGVVSTLAQNFNFPSGVAVATGAVFVSDGFNHAIRRVELGSGDVTTLAGSLPSSGMLNARSFAARFSLPYGVASDPAGNVYVAEGNSIRRITAEGVVTTLVTSLDEPSGVAYGPDGNLYVADPAAARVYRVTMTGMVTTLAGGSGEFGAPWGIAVDPHNNVYVTDLIRDRIYIVDSSGLVSAYAGTGTPGWFDGPAASSRFRTPTGIAVDSARNVYVTDWGNNAVRKYTLATGAVTTLVAPTAGLIGPTGIVADGSGNLYVSDANHVIYRISSTSGAMELVAGLPGTPGNVNGTGTRARFAFPEGLAFTSNGELVIADSFNHAIRIATVFAAPDRRRAVRR